METIEYTFTDRTGWAPGSWDSEPDKRQWTDSKTGYPCLFKRGPMGNLCGYVGLSEAHPFFGMPYNERIPTPEGWGERQLDDRSPTIALLLSGGEPDDNRISMDAALDVHGGVTYTDMCEPGEPEHGICHKPAPGEPKHIWWIGFDCAHAWDFMPGMDAMLRGHLGTKSAPGIYRDAAYVTEECAKLAAQLAKIAADLGSPATAEKGV